MKQMEVPLSQVRDRNSKSTLNNSARSQIVFRFSGAQKLRELKSDISLTKPEKAELKFLEAKRLEYLRVRQEFIPRYFEALQDKHLNNHLEALAATRVALYHFRLGNFSNAGYFVKWGINARSSDDAVQG